MKLVKEQNIYPTTKQPQSASTSSCAEKGSKRPVNAIHTISAALVYMVACLIGEDNEK